LISRDDAGREGDSAAVCVPNKYLLKGGFPESLPGVTVLHFHAKWMT